MHSSCAIERLWGVLVFATMFVSGAPEAARAELAFDDVAQTSCCSCQSCGCNDGYCISLPMSEELSRRMTAMASSMAESGVVYNASATQFYQGVASGGAEQVFEYGGKVDQFLTLDSGQLGLWQGMSMIMHAETRFGQDVNAEAVGFAPVNVAMLYPNANEHETAITGLTFAQALNDEVQLRTDSKITSVFRHRQGAT